MPCLHGDATDKASRPPTAVRRDKGFCVSRGAPQRSTTTSSHFPNRPKQHFPKTEPTASMPTVLKKRPIAPLDGIDMPPSFKSGIPLIAAAQFCKRLWCGILLVFWGGCGGDTQVGRSKGKLAIHHSLLSMRLIDYAPSCNDNGGARRDAAPPESIS